MGRAVSNDLRVRMVRGIAAGKSRREVAAQFEVAPSTAVRVQARYAATGSVAPAPQGRPKDRWRLRLPGNPGIDEVCPLLQHVATLNFVFGFVVDASRGAPLFVGEALLNPVPVEA